MSNARPRPLTGGFYWLPSPSDGVTAWHVLTCHDLGFGPDTGHVDLWPAVIERLAAAWGRDAQALRRLLMDRYAGLPRARITRPGRSYLILHGNDAPVPDWKAHVIRTFRLENRTHRFLFDEHEQVLAGDPERVEEALGTRLDRPGKATALDS